MGIEDRAMISASTLSNQDILRVEGLKIFSCTKGVFPECYRLGKGS